RLRPISSFRRDVLLHVPPRKNRLRSSSNRWLVDSLRNLHRQLERGRCFETGNLRLQAGARAFDEREELALEWLLALDLNCCALNSTPAPPINFSALVLIIERQIGVFLE